jgi:hypothetical protein
MNNIKLISFIAISALIIMVLVLHMAPTLLIGMLIYLLAKRLGDKLSLKSRKTSAHLSRRPDYHDYHWYFCERSDFFI